MVLLTFFHLAKTLLLTFYDVFFQKLHMFHLGSVDSLAAPARGRTIIVTGPTSGIGKETAAGLYRAGATVILACRDTTRGERLKSQLESTKTRGSGSLEVWQLDVSSLESVRAFAKHWEDSGRALDALINNAGVYHIAEPRKKSITIDGFEDHMGTNHLGHFLLTMLLLPSLRRAAAKHPERGARIVHVSSSLHALTRGINPADPHLVRGYFNETAYANSKLAQILFTREMRRRLPKDSNIECIAVHPGMVLTELARTIPRFMQQMQRILLSSFLLTAQQGARASVYAAVDPKAPYMADFADGYLYANCRPWRSSAASKDVTLGRWCWRWSAEQTGLPKEYDLADPSDTK